MNVIGIISEYNPFHNGHKYQIEEIRCRTGADYIIIAMSGDYVQRGAPAIADKYLRTEMALRNGADLVLELPVQWATASAELFAQGGVSLLAATGIVDTLAFGAETDDLPLLQEIATVLAEEPASYQAALGEALRSGKSYPAARAEAVTQYLLHDNHSENITPALSSGNHNTDPSSDNYTFLCDNKNINNKEELLSTLKNILSQPNNILAIEYLKALYIINQPTSPSDLLNAPAHCALDSQNDKNQNQIYGDKATRITPLLIPRVGDDYHAQDAQSQYASATAIRKLLFSQYNFIKGNDATNTQYRNDNNNFLLQKMSPTFQLQEVLPASCIKLLNDYQQTHRLLTADDFSEILGYRLLKLRPNGYTDYADVTPELSSRIAKNLIRYQNFTQFTELLKTRELTYTHISRALLHILLDIRKSPNGKLSSPSQPPYLRILGFRRESTPLLHTMKQHTSLPIVTKMADVGNILDKSAIAILQEEIFVSDLYHQLAQRTTLPPVNEISHGLVII